MHAEIETEEPDDDPEWFDEEDDLDDDLDYELQSWVHFNLGFPLDLHDAEWWTTLRRAAVHAFSDSAWVLWEVDDDPIEAVALRTAIARLSFLRPWDAAWSYVDPTVRYRFSELADE